MDPVAVPDLDPPREAELAEGIKRQLAKKRGSKKPQEQERTYRAWQAIYQGGRVIRPGELFRAKPSDRRVRAGLGQLIEDEPPAAVAEALARAQS